MMDYWQFTQSRSKCHVAPHEIKKDCCLVDARGMLLFVVEQVFLPMGEVWLMHNAGTQCTVEGREEAKGPRKIFTFKFFLSCHKIWILFHSQHLHTFHEWSLGFSSLSICPSGCPSSQGRLSPLCGTPRLGCPVCGSTCLLHRVRVRPWRPFLPFRFLSGAEVPTLCLFSILPSMWRSFLQLRLYRSSASFQLIFHENCSACGCIFDLFVGECKLHILLLCHLDLIPENRFFLKFFHSSTEDISK